MSTELQTKEEQKQITTVTDTAAIMSVIERAASDPNVDIDKMERLMAMHERMVNKNAEMSFTQAMTEAQSEMRPISANMVNNQTRSKYADYSQLDKVLRPIYTNHGFSLSFDTAETERQDYIKVTCIVSHKDGHSRSYSAPMPADGKGAKGGDVMTKTHAAGSAMTYGMRYLLKMVFNVAIGEDDTDGNMPVERITEKQAADLEALIEEVLGSDTGAFMNWMRNTLKARKIEDLNENGFNEAVRRLKQKKAEAK